MPVLEPAWLASHRCPRWNEFACIAHGAADDMAHDPNAATFLHMVGEYIDDGGFLPTAGNDETFGGKCNADTGGEGFTVDMSQYIPLDHDCPDTAPAAPATPVETK